MSNLKYYVKLKETSVNEVYGIRWDKEYPVTTSYHDETMGEVYNVMNESGELIGINHEYVDVRVEKY